MRILQCGVAYSPNVGDGLIASCMAYAVGRLLPGAEMVSLDFAGRRGFASEDRRSGLLGRTGALHLLSMMPGPARRAMVRAILGRQLHAQRSDWQAMIDEADAVIIGGGQLFADSDLNFPLKLGGLAALLATHRLPVAIHAAGVTGGWSAEGRALFGRLDEAPLRAVGLRDAGSIKHWQDQAGFGPTAILALDPGLLAAEAIPAPPRSTDAPIGLGIADPTLLSYHAEAGVAGGGLAFQVALAERLAEAGHRVLLFCNGAEEDARAVDRVGTHPALAHFVETGHIEVAPRPLTPHALAHTVASCRALVAHRLHAIIAAYAYGIPAVALGWDAKVASFHREVGRESFTLSDPRVDAGAVAGALGGVLDHPIAEAERAAMAARALADMAATLRCLGLPALDPGAAKGCAA
ncbi:MAG: polysaccharide pyruvyl transferase family protein [Pseudomonadota bacterium]